MGYLFKFVHKIISHDEINCMEALLIIRNSCDSFVLLMLAIESTFLFIFSLTSSGDIEVWLQFKKDLVDH